MLNLVEIYINLDNARGNRARFSSHFGANDISQRGDLGTEMEEKRA